MGKEIGSGKRDAAVAFIIYASLPKPAARLRIYLDTRTKLFGSRH
jgi:hypothetical protein